MLNKFLVFMCISSILTMLNNSLWESDVMKYAIYLLLLIFVGWSFRISYRYHPSFYQGKTSLFLLLVVVNILVSPYQPLYPRIIKYIGYISCFTLGYVFQERKWPLKCSKTLLYITLLLPLILVSVFDHTPHKTVFFPMSNTYSYFGLSCALFLFTVKNEQDKFFQWALVLMGLYIVSCSTLGIVMAMVVSVFIINRRNTRLLVWTALFILLIACLVMYSEFSVFTRIRDVVTLIKSMTLYDWTHLQDMDFYTFTRGVNMESDRDDNASFLWRLAQWMNVMDDFGENLLTAIPLGLGDNFAVDKTGYACHNEYLKIFAENGIIVFVIIMSWMFHIHRVLKRQKVYYFVLAVFVYHFTENLIDTFVANSLIYFSIGFVYCKYKQNKMLTV